MFPGGDFANSGFLWTCFLLNERPAGCVRSSPEQSITKTIYPHLHYICFQCLPTKLQLESTGLNAQQRPAPGVSIVSKDSGPQTCAAGHHFARHSALVLSGTSKQDIPSLWPGWPAAGFWTNRLELPLAGQGHPKMGNRGRRRTACARARQAVFRAASEVKLRIP